MVRKKTGPIQPVANRKPPIRANVQNRVEVTGATSGFKFGAQHHTRFLHRSWGLNSGPCVCTASNVLTAIFPARLSRFS